MKTRTRARASRRARAREGKGKRKGKGQGKGQERARERERVNERIKVWAIIFINRPGQNEKNPRTSDEAVQFVFISHKSELFTYYPAAFKIVRENRYVWKICMILVSVVCRPAGHKIFYVPLAYILHLLDSCRFSKRICFPGRF